MDPISMTPESAIVPVQPYTAPKLNTALGRKSRSPKDFESDTTSERPSISSMDGCFTVFSSWCVQFATAGHVNAFGVYDAFYKEVYLSNESPFTIGWIGSVPWFCYLGFGLLSGALSDRGYNRHLLASCSILYIFCNYMLAISAPHQWYQVFLSQGLGMGLAMGGMAVPSLAIVGHHYPKRHRSLALGIVTTGAAFGGIVYPIMLNNLINPRRSTFGSGGTPETFRSAVEISAGFSAGLLLLANVFQREKRPLEEHTKTHLHIILLLKEPKYLMLCVGSIFVYYGSVFPVIYLQLFSVTKGFPVRFSFYLLPMFHAASVVGRVLLNFSADRFGSLKVLIITTIGTGAVTFGFLGIGSPAGMTVVTLLIGFFAGGYNSMVVTTAAGFSKRISETGVRIGVLSLFLALPSLSGPPIDGALLTERLIWDRPIIFSSICVIVGACLYVVASIIKTRATSASHSEAAADDEVIVSSARISMITSHSLEKTEGSEHL
ncbi:MFS general substrate transporter [Sistotremastrum suecicum HHB10207 ss-3]|uniref:MFS general substrate transporter n=1 Tax=Sistotremastrum suecicum HHB10207 ss-3 TaxID=1314776 RepID=A0A165YJC3_9AGAM|nr:MFS general substrate transporter [Sistotremastrum suecicum HHB10207 ss-3]